MVSFLPGLVTRHILVTLQGRLDIDRPLSPIHKTYEPIDSHGRVIKRLRWGFVPGHKGYVTSKSTRQPYLPRKVVYQPGFQGQVFTCRSEQSVQKSHSVSNGELTHGHPLRVHYKEPLKKIWWHRESKQKINIQHLYASNTSLMIIMENLLSSNEVPEDWKHFTVAPVFIIATLGNSRPINLTWLICKVMEISRGETEPHGHWIILGAKLHANN